MYNKEEAKALRMEFWEQFQDFTNKRRRKIGGSGKWVLDRTGINGLTLKFHFDSKDASVGIDVETRNLDKRLEIWEKLEAVQQQINTALGEDTLWDLDFTRENSKPISRIHRVLENVSIFNREDWNRVNMFFFDRMLALEEFYTEYKDYLRYS